MNSLHTVKKISMVALLTFAFHTGTVQIFARSAKVKKGECQFTKMYEETTELVPEAENPLKRLLSLFLAIARIADPTIAKGPAHEDFHDNLEKIKFDGILARARAEANILSDLADEVDSHASKRLQCLADDIRAICGIFEDHITKNSKFNARMPIPLAELQSKLEPYTYLLPLELDQPDQSTVEKMAQWKKIISVLY